ncbi:sensor histidine kinase [Pedobacter hartonius]|uniref:GHKL domain-containing protein n=1 Tax=Pedobacter hartonius TaxID=425514 RepID=A0A1H4G7Q7_9SPHI|nr:histidine kinase [Pedobacter hartonius]SEB05629.1 GHKL domain-containing protein [Pedobacter hartonius]
MTDKIKYPLGFFGNYLYIFLSLLVSVPIFLAIESYVKPLGVHEDEAVSFASTVCFILGVFAGRYISQFWSATLKSLPKMEVLGLATLIVICIGWLFFHADFPLEGRTGINLMLFWVPFAMISILSGILIKVIHSVTENQLQEAQSIATHSKSELHLLQSQLSPHFLFNTLNNMYGLSITDHQKIPDLLLKLSELLRYSVYDATETYVPLKDELTYISNYIEFEKIRIGDRLALSTDVEEIGNANIKIAPMMLIVFIENAFKHSKNTTDQQIFIDIKLKTWGNSILFSVRNSYGKEEQETTHFNKNSGLGLANVSKRLELLYSNAHMINIQSDALYYNVDLQLKMKS